MRPKININWHALKQPHVLISAVIGAIAAASYAYYEGVFGWDGILPAILLGFVGFVFGTVGAPNMLDPRTRRTVLTSIAIYAGQALIIIGGRWGQPNDAGLFPLFWTSAVGAIVAEIYLRDPKVIKNGILIGSEVGIVLSLCLIVASRGDTSGMEGWHWLPLPLLMMIGVIAITYITASFGAFYGSHFIARQSEETPVQSILMPPSEDFAFEYDTTTGILADKVHDAHGYYIHLNGTLFRCSNAEYKEFRVGKRYTIYYDPSKIIVGAREFVAGEI